MNKPEFRDGALLILRICLGLVYCAHGWDKFALTGLATTSGYFDKLGIPAPALVASVAAAVELVGGALLIVGFLTTAGAGVLLLDVAGAFWFSTRHSGIFVLDPAQGTIPGWEYSLILAAALVTVVVFGAGRASADFVLSRSQKGKK